MKWICLTGMMPLVIVGFLPLSSLATSLSIRQERPVELKESLASPTTGYLAKRVIYQDNAFGGISSISRANCLSGRGNETLLAFRRGAVILDAHYEEQRRIAFSNRNYQTVHAVHARKAHTCGFIVYKLFNHVALLDPTGTELWRTPKEANSERPIDGVQYGDIDGDRRSEFVIYARYREGIVLVNESGKTLWKHPVYALGHLAMGDV